MHKTLTSVVALAGLAAAAGAAQAGDAVVAGDINEPMELSLDQMDGVTAGRFCYSCSNFAYVFQYAVAAASAYSFYGDAYASAEAENSSQINQSNQQNGGQSND
jgi:hypothetical protein